MTVPVLDTPCRCLVISLRESKSADALRPGGLLATVGTHHIAGGTWTEAFFVEIQKCYERFDPSTPPGLRLETARDIVEDDRELTLSGRFAPAKFYRYERSEERRVGKESRSRRGTE